MKETRPSRKHFPRRPQPPAPAPAPKSDTVVADIENKTRNVEPKSLFEDIPLHIPPVNAYVDENALKGIEKYILID